MLSGSEFSHSDSVWLPEKVRKKDPMTLVFADHSSLHPDKELGVTPLGVAQSAEAERMKICQKVYVLWSATTALDNLIYIPSRKVIGKSDASMTLCTFLFVQSLYRTN